MPASQLNGIFVMLIGMGGLLIILGAWVFIRTRRPQGRTLRSSGVVISLEESEDDGNTIFSPVVKFAAHDGTEITFTDDFGSYPALYKVDERVEVSYDPRNFRNARITSSIRRYLPALILLVLGAAALSVGLAFVRSL